MTGNANLNTAARLKNDEFYTRLEDIEDELCHYTEFFKGKTILCNCDDPRISNFFHYFSYNFHSFGLKKLITTCYKNQNRDLFSQYDSEKAIWLEYNGEKDGGRVPTPEQIGIHELQGDGDFRSTECIELLKQADIVVTNPPFSLLREYIAQLIHYDKKFVIVGNKNAITYKEIFPLIKSNKIWVGATSLNGGRWMIMPKGINVESKGAKIDSHGNVIVNVPGVCWFTNLDIKKRHEPLILTETYRGHENKYPRYDNYDAIDISKINDIPEDYTGLMGVPITFMNKFCPEQFEIIDITNSNFDNKYLIKGCEKYDRPYINGKRGYAKIMIKNKQPEI